MGRIRKFTTRTVFFLLALGMALAVPANAASPRLRMDYYWPETPTTVYFTCQFEGTERTACQYPMGAWNNVLDFDGNRMVRLEMVRNPSEPYSEINFKYDNSGAAAYCDPHPQTGPLSWVEIWVNTKYPYTVGAQSGTRDLQSLIVHELGHALGVAHCHSMDSTSPCFSSTCTSNVMNPSVPKGKNRRVLSDYDKSSYRVIYDLY